MNVLMVNKFLYPNGGSETYVFKLGEYLTTKGHDVQYFGMQHEGMCVGTYWKSSCSPRILALWSRQTAARLQLHRSSTFPPSLWPDRELRKYHCPSALVVARPVAIRSLLQWLYRSAFRVMAGLQLGSEAPHLTAQGMYLSGCVYAPI